MNTAIVIAAVASALIGWLATATATPAARRREADRRRRRVGRNPALANLGDVQRRLDADLTVVHADFVIERIARHRIDAATLWTWLDRFGAEALVLSLAAGDGYAGLLRILRGEKAYDVDEARLLAELSEPELFDLAAIWTVGVSE